MNFQFLLGGLFAVIILATLFFVLQTDITETIGVVGDVHKHADFKVFLNGKEVNFSQAKYMSTPNRALNNFLHLHDMDGDVVHQHASGVTLGMFFRSLEMQFNSTCFVLEDKQTFCNDGQKTLKFFINGQQNSAFDAYEFNDLDRILISYGNDAAAILEEQLNSVTDKSCIQSKKCPEQGVPSNESSCLTGEDCVVIR